MSPDQKPSRLIRRAGLGPDILVALAEQGPMRVADIRQRLHIRRQTLLRALSELCATGQIVKSSSVKLGADGRPRRVSVYELPERASGGGSQAPDGGSRTNQPSESGTAAEPGLLLVEAQRLFHENNDLVLKGPAVALGCSNESLMQGLGKAQAQVFNGFFSLNLAHAGRTVANLASAWQVRSGSLTALGRMSRLNTHSLRTHVYR